MTWEEHIEWNIEIWCNKLITYSNLRKHRDIIHPDDEIIMNDNMYKIIKIVLGTRDTSNKIDCIER